VTLHGPLLDRLGKGLIAPKYEKELHNILWGKTKEVEFKTLKPMNKAAKDLKQVKASVIGGNMTVLQSTLGTPWQIKTKGKFIFFEELAERGYRIDRIFEHFRQCGLFRGCSGIILGDFIGGQEPQGGSKIDPVLERWAQDLTIPVFKGLQAGHGEIQRPVPFNTECELVKHNSTYRLSILTGGK
jgi:muramoyltetrapeptide carboxypeptidase